MFPDDQVHPDTHVLSMVNYVIGVVNYVIAAGPSLLNFVIADTAWMSGLWPATVTSLRSRASFGSCVPRAGL